MVSPVHDIETYHKTDELIRVFRSAVRKAQAENRRLGIPNYFSLSGQRYMEMPNGEIVRLGKERAVNGFRPTMVTGVAFRNYSKFDLRG